MKEIDNKQEDVTFINKFSKITISKACKHFGYNQSNVCHGKSTKEAIKKVRKYIENELASIYKEESSNYVKKDNTL